MSPKLDTKKFHLYLGRAVRDGLPVLIPLSAILKNLIIFGSPGSGKSVQLCWLIRQLIRSGLVSVSVFNPKPIENDIFGTMLREVENLRSKRPGESFPFWHFSMRPGRSSYLLNVFANSRWEKLSPNQQAQIIMSALSFSHSRNGADVFFTDSSRKIVEFALTKAKKNGEIVHSFKRLHDLLVPLMNPRNKEIAEHLRKYGAHVTYLIERMAVIESINPDGHAPEVLTSGIDLGRFVEEPCFAYYELDSFIDPAAAGEVASSSMSSFFTQISEAPAKVPHVFFIDEFAQIVARNLAQLFRQARATNCGFVLATQSVTDLIDGEVDLLDTVMATTQVQVFKRVSDPAGMRLLREMGGVRCEHAASYSLSENSDGKRSVTRGFQETLVERLNVPEIEKVNSDQNLDFVRIVGHEGFARFKSAMFINRWDYDRTFEEYQEICNTPWPEPGPGMIVVGQKGPILPTHPEVDLDDHWEPVELGPERIEPEPLSA